MLLVDGLRIAVRVIADNHFNASRIAGRCIGHERDRFTGRERSRTVIAR